MRGPDLGAVDLLARAVDAGFGIQRAQFLVRLPQRVLVDTGAIPRAAVTSSAGRGIRRLCNRRPTRQPRAAGRIVILQAGRVRAAVVLELGFDPVDRSTIAGGALPAVAELREPFDRRLVFLEVQASDQDPYRIDCSGRSGRSGHTISLFAQNLLK